MPKVRYVLTQPVENGTDWFTISRQVLCGEQWICNPDFQIVMISGEIPSAPALARLVMSQLEGTL